MVGFDSPLRKTTLVKPLVAEYSFSGNSFEINKVQGIDGNYIELIPVTQYP